MNRDEMASALMALQLVDAHQLAHLEFREIIFGDERAASVGNFSYIGVRCMTRFLFVHGVYVGSNVATGFVTTISGDSGLTLGGAAEYVMRPDAPEAAIPAAATRSISVDNASGGIGNTLLFGRCPAGGPSIYVPQKVLLMGDRLASGQLILRVKDFLVRPVAANIGLTATIFGTEVE